MKRISTKNFSLGILKVMLPLLVLLFVQTAAQAQTYTPEEQNCYNLVQGKIPWNTAGATKWADQNVRNLCKGTTNATATIKCFGSSIASGLAWDKAIAACASTAMNPSPAPAPAPGGTTPSLNGNWTGYFPDGTKSTYVWRIGQSGSNLDFLDVGAGTNTHFTGLLADNTITDSNHKTGVLAANGTEIHWSDHVVWRKNPGSPGTNQPLIADIGTGPLTPANPVELQNVKITANLQNNAAIVPSITLYRSDQPAANALAASSEVAAGQTATATFSGPLPLGTPLEVEVKMPLANNDRLPIYWAKLTPNAGNTYCFTATGSVYQPSVAPCSGTTATEERHITLENRGTYDTQMTLDYTQQDAQGNTSAKTLTTDDMPLGFDRVIYLPRDAAPGTNMTLKVHLAGGSAVAINLLTTVIDPNASDSPCYKAEGNFGAPQLNPCSIDNSARTIKLHNNAGFTAKLKITYYSRDQSGNDVGISLPVSFVLAGQDNVMVVPQTSSTKPIDITFIVAMAGFSADKNFSPTTAPSNFTGQLCYQVEGTFINPVASTCNGTVGVTSGATRQIKFENNAGYDAQMAVMYFQDQTTSGVTIPTPQTVATGYINGLGGKFRMVAIPTNTSKGQSIIISLQGNATVKNDIWSTTLPADFAASSIPCYQVTGTLFNPSGGTCN